MLKRKHLKTNENATSKEVVKEKCVDLERKIKALCAEFNSTHPMIKASLCLRVQF